LRAKEFWNSFNLLFYNIIELFCVISILLNEFLLEFSGYNELLLGVALEIVLIFYNKLLELVVFIEEILIFDENYFFRLFFY
jgi:hypothetical protein